MPQYREIPIELIDAPELPARSHMDTHQLDELADSIKKHGVLEPLLVVVANGARTKEYSDSFNDWLTPYINSRGRFEVAAGHRRYLAAGMAALTTLPCMVYQPGEIHAEAVKLEENICREDLTAAEQGWFILELVEKHGMSLDELCRRLRRSEAWVQERVDLVEKDPEVAKAVAHRQVNFSVAKELLKCPDEQYRRYLLSLAVEHGSTARTIQFQVAQWKQAQAPPLPVAAAASAVGSAEPPPQIVEHCIFCGVADDPQNLISKRMHFYHWRPIKKYLEDNGIEVKD